MRKLLLASAAVLGVMTGMTETGFAQSSDDSGQAATPAPGTITVRLNGRFRFYAGIQSESDKEASYYYDPTTGTARETPFYQSAYGATVNAKTGAITAAPATKQFNKTGGYQFLSYARLYPGFDGVAANGLKYGASLEIRQDNNAGAGGGVYGSNSQESRAKGYLYFRREWGYIGTDKLGTIRVGATDGPSGLFMVGNFENFNDGGWNGDVTAFINGNAQITWPFADVGNLYTTEKVVYLSPQFYGFDVGLAYEPNTSNVNGDGSTGCNAPSSLGGSFIGSGPGVSGAGCSQLSSTSTSDYRRRRNTFDIAARYRGTFGPVGLAAFINYIGGGRVADSGNVTTTINATTGSATDVITSRLGYKGLNVGVGGLAVTYAGLTVGGMVQGGAVNGQWAAQPKGEPDSFAWLVGASYTYGPLIVGASYYDYIDANAQTPANSATIGRERTLGVAAGGTYSLAPGVALFLSYLWGQKHQRGYDYLVGAAAPANVPGLHNTMNSQVITLGTSFTW
jgi:predicted porin